MGFGSKRAPAPAPKPIPLPLEPPKDLASDMLWNLSLGLFVLLAVLFLGQAGRLLLFIGGKLSSAMVRMRSFGWGRQRLVRSVPRI